VPSLGSLVHLSDFIPAAVCLVHFIHHHNDILVKA
jgi:hypothetical protein